MNTIELSTCKPGQKLKLRSGSVWQFLGLGSDLWPQFAHPQFPFVVSDRMGERHNYRQDGRYYGEFSVDPRDIVEILPLQTDTSAAKPKTPQEIYLAGQAAADFKPGERVKVLFKVPSGAGGWIFTWNPAMDAAVGKAGVIKGLSGTGGVCVDMGLKSGNWCFPYFCLERVAPEPVKVMLNDTWTAEVVSKDEVKVGDQTFKVEALRGMLRRLECPPSVRMHLSDSCVVDLFFQSPASVKVQCRDIPVENLRKLLASVDSFPA